MASGMMSKTTTFQISNSPLCSPRSQGWQTSNIRYSGSIVTSSSRLTSPTGGSLILPSAKQRMTILRSPSNPSKTSVVDCTLLNANDRKVFSAPSSFMDSGGAWSLDSTVPAGLRSCRTAPSTVTSPRVTTPRLSTPPLSSPRRLASSPQVATPRPGLSNIPKLVSSFSDIANTAVHSNKVATPRPCLANIPKLVSSFSDISSVASSAAVLSNKVTVGRRIFECKRKIGQGSFAVVWEVQEYGGVMNFADASAANTRTAKPTGVPLALKCSSPRTPQMLEACVFEAEVLQQLAASLQPDADAGQRVPRYVTHSQTCKLPATSSSHSGIPSPRQPVSKGQNQVLLAMSKLGGKPLDQWLYGVDENRLKTLPMAELLDGPLPGGQLGTRDLAGASAASSSLISQMAPVLAALEPIAFHRDISAHNFLIRATPEGEKFSLLDFGLAVRSNRWQTDYKSKSICGDPRYFTPTAWMLMVYGHKYVNNYPDANFLQQYLKRIDHFSFGVLALEVFFTLWHGPAAEGMTGDTHPMVQAWKAWRSFWSEAVGLFQQFHAKGPVATQQALSRSGSISRYVQLLKALCASLRSAASACTTCQSASLVFKISADLLHPCGTIAWKSLPAQLPPVWQVTLSKKGQQKRSTSAGGTEGQARPWSGVLESGVGWIAMSLTRGMLDLAWTGTCPPPKKTVLTPRRQKATCFTTRGC